MFVMWDRGFRSYDMFEAVTSGRGADVLARLPGHVKPEMIRALPDGSQLVRLKPSDYHRRKAGEHLVLRLIEYTIDDEARPGHGQPHRLLTTLVDPREAPAQELACAYHERWEIELTIDEVKTHELFSRRLRSQKPLGVLQELYGALMHEAAMWRYTTEVPADDWMAPSFDAGTWNEGAGGFGSEAGHNAGVGTKWTSAELWVRRSFICDSESLGQPYLRIYHDDAATVYLNGEQIADLDGWTASYMLMPLDADAQLVLREGQNTLAIHAQQDEGGQYLDAGLVYVRE